MHRSDVPSAPTVHAIQARLDALSKGRWSGGHSGEPTSWLPADGLPLQHIGSATQVAACVATPHVWVHLIGDSSVRYMYAAWLTLFNGTERAPGYPRHTLPDADRCSFLRAGRAEFRPCIQRWRGIFATEDHLRLPRQRADGDGWTVSYESWHVNTSAPPGGSPISPEPFVGLEARFGYPGSAEGRRGPPQLVIFGTGIWEAYGGLHVVRRPRPRAASATASPTAAGGRRARSFEYHRDKAAQSAYYHAQLAYCYGNATAALGRELPARLLVLGNGACRRQQQLAWPHVAGGDWPPEQMEQLVSEGNARVEAWVRAAQHRAPTNDAAAGGGVANAEEVAAPRLGPLRRSGRAGRQHQRHARVEQQLGQREQDEPPMLRPLFLDRASSMESVPKLTSSPCFHHHPYGLLSDTHVQMVLNALCVDRARSPAARRLL